MKSSQALSSQWRAQPTGQRIAAYASALQHSTSTSSSRHPAQRQTQHQQAAVDCRAPTAAATSCGVCYDAGRLEAARWRRAHRSSWSVDASAHDTVYWLGYAVLCRNNTSDYYVNNKKMNVKEVTTLLKSKGIDLDNNRFLILQVRSVWCSSLLCWSHSVLLAYCCLRAPGNQGGKESSADAVLVLMMLYRAVSCRAATVLWSG